MSEEQGQKLRKFFERNAVILPVDEKQNDHCTTVLYYLPGMTLLQLNHAYIEVLDEKIPNDQTVRAVATLPHGKLEQSFTFFGNKMLSATESDHIGDAVIFPHQIAFTVSILKDSGSLPLGRLVIPRVIIGEDMMKKQYEEIMERHFDDLLHRKVVSVNYEIKTQFL